MTERLYFDTDCVSSFLWVKQEDILINMYRDRIVLPQEVLVELSNPSIPHIKNRITALLAQGDISIQSMLINSEEYNFFHAMALAHSGGEIVIGKGEAAAIALAKVYGGIVASNNLKDVRKYIEKYQLKHITTGDILLSAMDNGLMDESMGNRIWGNMLLKRRILPADSFSDYLKIIKR